ncbi:MAG TPA: hypothetical protein PKV93_11640 [Fervidobacterium sp.]|uniref:hypothetical protein n=1 Tax=Acetomicrobium mobile TaxID=97477 RepID=UPI0026EE5ECD|nr:hypothetical protein [Acetomicrobium mobile]HQE49984.1 hypothetical protein [Fervidobacterium sp.]
MSAFWGPAVGAVGVRKEFEQYLPVIRGASIPYDAPGKHRLEQVRYSWEKLAEDTGVTTEDVQCRMCDFGMHYWTSHHPWIIPEP